METKHSLKGTNAHIQIQGIICGGIKYLPNIKYNIGKFGAFIADALKIKVHESLNLLTVPISDEIISDLVRDIAITLFTPVVLRLYKTNKYKINIHRLTAQRSLTVAGLTLSASWEIYDKEAIKAKVYQTRNDMVKRKLVKEFMNRECSLMSVFEVHHSIIADMFFQSLKASNFDTNQP